MATFRTSSGSYSVGNTPPEVTWTVVRGDTASFRVYVTDDAENPLNIADWTIKMDIKRNGLTVLSLTPAPTVNDSTGEYTVSLGAAQSALLETGDIFDIEMSDVDTVWTVAQGSMVIIEDITK
jgi:hypothetical protein